MRSNRNTAAFTLIEILITIVILSVGIVGILHAFESSMNALTQTRDVLFSTMLCRDKLSDIRSDIATGRALEGASSGSFDGSFKNYRWGTESSLVPHNVKTKSSGNGSDKDKNVKIDLYKLKVSVWRNGYPNDRQELVTYLRQRAKK